MLQTEVEHKMRLETSVNVKYPATFNFLQGGFNNVVSTRAPVSMCSVYREEALFNHAPLNQAQYSLNFLQLKLVFFSQVY